LRPHLALQRELRPHCRGNRVGCVGEHGERRVALAFVADDDAAVFVDGVADECIVAFDGVPHDVRIRLPQPSRPFDVGHQERDGAGRKLARPHSVKGRR
jgi:hypothetical protein